MGRGHLHNRTRHCITASSPQGTELSQRSSSPQDTALFHGNPLHRTRDWIMGLPSPLETASDPGEYIHTTQRLVRGILTTGYGTVSQASSPHGTAATNGHPLYGAQHWFMVVLSTGRSTGSWGFLSTRHSTGSWSSSPQGAALSHEATSQQDIILGHGALSK
jgi:hypothetical protein